MALSNTRRKIRIQSLELAASMIADYASSGGMLPKDIGLNGEREMKILEQENKRTSDKLYAMATKLKKEK